MLSLSVYHPKCLISGDLVYVSNLKCASTFFYHNLRRAGWDEIEFLDVRIDQHRVFGHVLDPWLKRAKGHAEFLYMNYMCRLFLEDPRVQKLTLNILIGDYHSVSYSSYLGDRVWKVDWIPLNVSNHSVIAHTELLLKHHGKQIPIWDMTAEHRSAQIKTQCAQRLLELMTSREARTRLAQEVSWCNIYRSVQAPSWPVCDWLEATANLPDMIKQEMASMDIVQENFLLDPQNLRFEARTDNVDESMMIFDRITCKYLEQDLQLYQAVLEQFQPDQTDWNQISWLSHHTI